MGIFRSAALSFISAASLVFVLGGCAAPESVSRDIHVKRGVTLEDDLIHFYGAPSQRIIRGDSEYFVYNARTMNITSADGTACRGTPVFIFSYETKRLSDLKCRENIPAEELSNKAGDSIVVGVTDSGKVTALIFRRSRPRRGSRGLTPRALPVCQARALWMQGFPLRTSGAGRACLLLTPALPAVQVRPLELRGVTARVMREPQAPGMRSRSRAMTGRCRSSTGKAPGLGILSAPGFGVLSEAADAESGML